MAQKDLAERHQMRIDGGHDVLEDGRVIREGSNALKSLSDGSLTGKREQEIYTPPNLLDAVGEVWPEGIAMDPCTGPSSYVDSKDRMGPGCLFTDGLAHPWPARSYCNPPYADLEKWLAHASRQWEVMLLGPVRSHRVWWQQHFRDCDAIAFLLSIKFVGYSQPFPAPVCMIYWGDRTRAFRHAFRPHGHVLIQP